MRQGKDCCVRSDTQGEGKDGNQSEAWRVPDLTRSKAYILNQRIDEWKSSLPAIAFLRLGYPAKFEKCGPPRILWRHTAAQVLFDGKFKMHKQFFVKRVVEVPLAEDSNAAAPQSLQPVHSWTPKDAS